MRLDSFSAASSSALRSSSLASATSSNDASRFSRSLEFTSTICFRVAIRSLWSSFIFLADSSVLSLRGGFTLSCGLAGAISRVAAMTARINAGFLIVDLRERATPFLPSAMRERSCNCTRFLAQYRESGLFIDLPFSGCRGKLLLAHVPVQYRRHDGHEHEDEDGGEWTGLGEGCHRDNRRESEMACAARDGKAGAVAGFRAAEQMPDGQAPESEDRDGA